MLSVVCTISYLYTELLPSLQAYCWVAAVGGAGDGAGDAGAGARAGDGTGGDGAARAGSSATDM